MTVALTAHSHSTAPAVNRVDAALQQWPSLSGSFLYYCSVQLEGDLSTVDNLISSAAGRVP